MPNVEGITVETTPINPTYRRLRPLCVPVWHQAEQGRASGQDQQKTHQIVRNQADGEQVILLHTGDRHRTLFHFVTR